MYFKQRNIANMYFDLKRNYAVVTRSPYIYLIVNTSVTISLKLIIDCLTVSSLTNHYPGEMDFNRPFCFKSAAH